MRKRSSTSTPDGPRTALRRTLAVLFALAIGIGLLGWIDLTFTWGLQERGTVFDIAYGGVTGIIVPAGFLAQWRERPAALRQTGAAAIAYALAGVISGQLRYTLLAFVVATAALVLLALEQAQLRLPVRVSVPLALLTLAAAGPLMALALRAAAQERRHASLDSHAGFHVWPGVAAMAFAVVLVALLAAIFPTGRRLAATSAAAVAAYYGLASIIHPDYPASAGRAWGAAGVVWGVTVALAAARSASHTRAPNRKWGAFSLR